MSNFNKYFREHNVKANMIQEINAPEGKERVDLKYLFIYAERIENEFGHSDFCYGDDCVFLWSV